MHKSSWCCRDTRRVPIQTGLSFVMVRTSFKITYGQRANLDRCNLDRSQTNANWLWQRVPTPSFRSISVRIRAFTFRSLSTKIDLRWDQSNSHGQTTSNKRILCVCLYHYYVVYIFETIVTLNYPGVLVSSKNVV